MIIAFVFAFFGGAVCGIVLAALLGTAARQSAVERSYWTGVRAASGRVSRVSAFSRIDRRQPPMRQALARDRAGGAAEPTRRAG